MAASNYDDVLDQLRAGGLIVEDLQVGTPRMIRCKVEGGDREKRGWYMLHELPTSNGDLLIVGSFGVWHGNDQGAQKIQLRKADDFTREQREALRRRLAEDRKRADADRKREAERAAARATAAWSKLEPDGESEYLARKGVAAHGLRFTAGGSAVLPLLDTAGRIHGLQFLRTSAQAAKARRPAKEFWPAGLIKKGHFHLIGAPQHLVLVAEGYATGATLHEATGYPVAIAFDAGNLVPVVAALRSRYKRTRILICADDDAFGESNAGVNGASAAALEVDGAWVIPRFADEVARRAKFDANGHKLTDFNDLHALEGLHVVRTQIEARLSELDWRAPVAPAPTTGGEGRGEKLKPIESTADLLERYSLVYAHSGAVFDRQEHILLSLSDMRDACVRKDIHRGWVEHPARDIVRIREVGFDPAGDDPSITCNLYGGWPTVPKAGKCDRLLDLLQYMCSADPNADHLYRWVLKWIAYPLQHPGAKMKSTLVIHGPQGTGKNLFFEALMSIYGEYGDVIDQSSIEDKFNDWASRKLFMLADEVVARSDLFHVKNKLKGLITGDRIRINPKNFAAYWERNHLNLVFLSNEAMPVVLDEDDRRHCVIWTPPKKDPGYYAAVMAEIRDGGAAALHDYLLHLDLGEFSNGTLPPNTGAKADLIGLGLDSPMRFYDEVIMGDVRGLEPMPGLATDWYAAYTHWCRCAGMRAAPQPKFSHALAKKRDVPNPRKKYRPYSEAIGPHGFLLFDDPHGEKHQRGDRSELDWLGGCVVTHRQMVDEYRGVTK